MTSQETGSEKNEWSTMTSYVSPETSLIILPPFAHLVTRIQRRERFGSGMKKLRRKITSSHALVSTEFFCVNKSSSWAFFVLWFEHVFVAALRAVTGSPVTHHRQHVPRYARKKRKHRVPAKKNKAKNDKWVAPPPMKMLADTRCIPYDSQS